MKHPPDRRKPSPYYPPKDPKKTGIIVAIGAFIMIAGHLGLWEMEKRAVPPLEPPPISSETTPAAPDFDLGLAPPQQYPGNIMHKIKKAWKGLDKKETQEPSSPAARETFGPYPAAPPPPPPAKISKSGKPYKIAVIIDDMAVSWKPSYEMVNMPAPLTLAFLPYAQGLKKITQDARKNGHELMIHMPMEPMNSKLDVGTIAILDDMKEKEIRENLHKAFDSFDGYSGINNHMGSRVTQNEKIMNIVMEELAKRHLFFVDSKTIETSVAARTAAAHGLNYAERDIFLDHQETDEFVETALTHLEQVARRRGYAIAIGHPKAVTIRGLKKWLPTLKEKGFEIVPVSTLMRHENDKNEKQEKPAISPAPAPARLIEINAPAPMPYGPPVR